MASTILKPESNPTLSTPIEERRERSVKQVKQTRAPALAPRLQGTVLTRFFIGNAGKLVLGPDD